MKREGSRGRLFAVMLARYGVQVGACVGTGDAIRGSINFILVKVQSVARIRKGSSARLGVGGRERGRGVRAGFGFGAVCSGSGS